MAFSHPQFALPEDWSIEPVGDHMWHVWHTRSDGRVEITSYDISSGITLMDIDITCRTLPVSSVANASNLMLNWCSQGRCEVDLGQKGSAVLEAGLMCVSMTTAQAFAYPTGPYRGFEYHVNFGQIDNATKMLLRSFGIDLPELGQRLCGNTLAFMVKPTGALMRTVEAINDLTAQSSPATGPLFAATCQLFALLNTIDLFSQRATSAYLQRSQRDLARRLQATIEADPAHGHVAALARTTGVGEASLRDYFSRMYGKAPATYARELVLERAAEMLATESASISDVAMASNYSNPSKFSAAFKRRFGITPTEYRRCKRLERLDKSGN